MTAQPYPEQIDCVWLAIDREGHVAAFVTAGSGPISRQLLEAGLLAEEIEDWIEELPRTSGARVLVSLARPDDYVGMAERGIFAYDWSDVHRTTQDEIGAYELMAAPTRPINVTQLPRELAAIAALSKIEDVTFEKAERVDVRRSFSCIEGGSQGT